MNKRFFIIVLPFSLFLSEQSVFADNANVSSSKGSATQTVVTAGPTQSNNRCIPVAEQCATIGSTEDRKKCLTDPSKINDICKNLTPNSVVRN